MDKENAILDLSPACLRRQSGRFEFALEIIKFTEELESKNNVKDHWISEKLMC
jgi:hypothetical protein